jgi:hypothetical protein
MKTKNWIHPANHITIIEGQEENTHFIQAYTDGSRNETGVGSGIAVFADSYPYFMQFNLNNIVLWYF